MFFLKFLAKMLSLFSPAAGFATVVVAGVGYGIYRVRRIILYRYYRFRRRRMPGWKATSTGAPRLGRPPSPATLRSALLAEAQSVQKEHRRALE
jgi:hypothetical protein